MGDEAKLQLRGNRNSVSSFQNLQVMSSEFAYDTARDKSQGEILYARNTISSALSFADITQALCDI